MGYKNFQEQLKEQLPKAVDKKFNDKLVTKFITYLLENGWENYNPYITDNIGEFCLVEHFYKYNVKIGIVQLLELEVGVDPSSCYDNVKKCSIVAKFPMSKRDYRRFIQKLESVTTGKERKQWLREAPTSWYGKYASYGIKKRCRE